MKPDLIKIIQAIGLLLFIAGAVYAAPDEINPKNARILFQVDHGTSYTVGYFSDFSGTVDISDDKTHVTAAHVAVRTASINTHSPVRDEGLKSPLFLDAAQFPEAVYDNGAFTIKGITKPVPLVVEVDPATGASTIHATIDRNDFGITYNKILPKKKKSIGDTVEIIVHLSSI